MFISSKDIEELNEDKLNFLDKRYRLIFNVFWLLPYFSFFALMSSMPLFAFQYEPDGFRGIKWRSEAEKHEDLQFVTAMKDVKVYKRTNEKLNIGDVNIKKINYFFYKNKFYKIVAYYTDTDSSALERNLSSVYGSGKREHITSLRDVERAGKASMSHFWYGKNVDIKLLRQTSAYSYNSDEPDCEGQTIGSSQTLGPVTFYYCLSYTYKAIDKQKQREERIMQEEERNKFLSEERKKEQQLRQQLRKNVEKDL